MTEKYLDIKGSDRSIIDWIIVLYFELPMVVKGLHLIK